MITKMEVEDLTKFAADHGAALEVRANNCTALPCLPCCQPRSLMRAGSPSAGKLLRDDFSVFPVSAISRFWSTSHAYLQLLEPGTAASPATAWQSLLCTWLRVQCPKSAIFLSLQYLLHSEQSQQQVPFEAKCHHLVLGTASIMVQKEKNLASSVTFLMSRGVFPPLSAQEVRALKHAIDV